MPNCDNLKIQGSLSEEFIRNFEWQWNTPHASHKDGVDETLIKSVREALNRVRKNQAFTEEPWAPLPKLGRRVGRTTHCTE